MGFEGLAEDPDYLRSKVLQTTLSEISSRPAAATSDNNDRDQGAGGADAAERCCVICLDVVSDPCEARPCSHRNFDFLCLVSWLNQRPSCPLCKAEINQVRYQFGADESGDGEDSVFASTSYSTYHVPRPPQEHKSQPAQQSGSTPAQHSSTRHGPSAPGFRLRDRPTGRYPRRPDPPPAAARWNSDEDTALSRRRRIYEHQLYSLHVGTNRITRYTDLTPQMFESDPTLVSRARMWIRRELRVFDFLCVAEGRRGAPGGSSSSSGNGSGSGGGDRTARQLSSNAEFLLEYVVAILRSMDIKGSRGQAEDMLQDFLGRENTRLFLHELRAWLRSPYTTLEAWDAHVQYDEAKATPAARVRRRPSDATIGMEEGRPSSTYLDRYRGGHGPARRSSSRAASSSYREASSPYPSRRTPRPSDTTRKRR